MPFFKSKALNKSKSTGFEMEDLPAFPPQKKDYFMAVGEGWRVFQLSPYINPTFLLTLCLLLKQLA
ncbi:hypothetical protein [Echinicola vietnamensis]|uniref:Uncharacterized protein n=1 Tax=Echinicola vietnamensis (strain DSM 17526 / LMG 23754 / KMM 6221) TaxID=926556 RepID=L0FVX4_ECHVK|nr:hypothetical protein [Echinicola vietnamensis]AGA77183.1 hypothetical protein Echvi_0910 [Echinicola vietnamensis DSM 17526]